MHTDKAEQYMNESSPNEIEMKVRYNETYDQESLRHHIAELDY